MPTAAGVTAASSVQVISPYHLKLANLLTSLRPAMPDDETDEYWKRFYEVAGAED